MVCGLLWSVVYCGLWSIDGLLSIVVYGQLWFVVYCGLWAIVVCGLLWLVDYCGLWSIVAGPMVPWSVVHGAWSNVRNSTYARVPRYMV